MEKTSGSRLLQMQARFQQKQMQEREMKIASLYEAQQARALDRVRHSPSNTTSPPHTQTHIINTQPGKVRQMFEERRTKGIDKSYPLQPIHNTERPTQRKQLPNGFPKVTANAKHVEKRTTKTTTTHSVKKQIHKRENLSNGGSGDLNHNHELDLNTIKQALPQNKGEMIPTEQLDRTEYMLENETFPDALAPAPTPRSPPPQPKPPARRSPPAKAVPSTRASPPKTKPTPTATAPAAQRKVTENAVRNKARGAMQRGAASEVVKPVPKRTAVSASSSHVSPKRSGSAGGGGGEPCAVCGRRFAAERLATHEVICRKSHSKKRKPFDVLKHRLAGTEAEPFINKLRKAPSKSTTKPLNSTWRQKHEEFISAIRAAKQVQAHLNAGGKLSDLPPPPPSENPDYVSCPHCARRFNQSAAERHIPKCATYKFNKNKPGNSKRR